MIVLKQYGARRTGTNYAAALIHTNFPDEVKVLDHEGGDKHDVPNVWALCRWEEESGSQVDGYVLSVRDPYAWFQSLIEYCGGAARCTPRFLASAVRQWNWEYWVWREWMRRKRGITLRWADATDHPGDCLGQIAERFGLDMPDEVLSVGAYVKADHWEHPDTATRFAKQRKYYAAKGYMDALGGLRRFIDEGIDWKLANSFGYVRELRRAPRYAGT